jgi:hypothetical protein
VSEEKELTIQLYISQLKAIEDAIARTEAELASIEAHMGAITNLKYLSNQFYLFHHHSNEAQRVAPSESGVSSSPPHSPSSSSRPDRDPPYPYPCNDWSTAAAAADSRYEWTPEDPPSALLYIAYMHDSTNMERCLHIHHIIHGCEGVDGVTAVRV